MTRQRLYHPVHCRFRQRGQEPSQRGCSSFPGAVIFPPDLQPASSMPFFSYPANADFLLPIVKLPLLLISSIFEVVLAVGPFGQIAIIAAFIALFTKNVMGPHRP